MGGVTNQIDFCRPKLWAEPAPVEDQGRFQAKVVDITNDWTGKRVSPVRFKDTHSYLFSDEIPKSQ